MGFVPYYKVSFLYQSYMLYVDLPSESNALHDNISHLTP